MLGKPRKTRTPTTGALDNFYSSAVPARELPNRFGPISGPLKDERISAMHIDSPSLESRSANSAFRRDLAGPACSSRPADCSPCDRSERAVPIVQLAAYCLSYLPAAARWRNLSSVPGSAVCLVRYNDPKLQHRPIRLAARTNAVIRMVDWCVPRTPWRASVSDNDFFWSRGLFGSWNAIASLHVCKFHTGLTGASKDGSIEEHPHPSGIEPEQCTEPGVSLMRLQIVPSGRDGAEEYGDFSAFSP